MEEGVSLQVFGACHKQTRDAFSRFVCDILFICNLHLALLFTNSKCLRFVTLRISKATYPFKVLIVPGDFIFHVLFFSHSSLIIYINNVSYTHILCKQLW